MTEESSYTTLCRRIVEHCHARGWYGSDAALVGGMETERYSVEVDGALRRHTITHDPRMGFEFAPATVDQVQTTELALGFVLPPLLRAVYTRVANGGFGPGEGLTGVQGGYVYGQDGRYTTIDRIEPPLWATQTLDLRAFEAMQDWPQTFKLPPHTWPTHFLHLCYWGCGTDSYVDALSERVYWMGGTGPATAVLMRQEESLERWLETWLRGKWRDWFPGTDVVANTF